MVVNPMSGRMFFSTSLGFKILLESHYVLGVRDNPVGQMLVCKTECNSDRGVPSVEIGAHSAMEVYP